MVHVAAAADGYVVGEELQRDDFQDGREDLRGCGDFDDVIGDVAGLAVAFRDDGYHDSVARFHFLDVGYRLFVAGHGGGVGFIARGDDDYRQIFVNQGVGAVLHFAGGIAFGVDVGNFFQFERAFEGDGVVDAASEVEKIGMAEKQAA